MNNGKHEHSIKYEQNNFLLKGSSPAKWYWAMFSLPAREESTFGIYTTPKVP